ncbi:unnamed protein product [Ambrosiozyma monospora]|uniref:Unnamed protein product n=1 Tax=Ambrosiozyma monospora TaxID=43982 RepID=A0ACB5TEW8_AMBMO|nr:unnamed protein product [Ambrosiozyma monospora]
MTSCCTVEFLVYRFGPMFFSNGSTSRRNKITANNKLVGKAKHGSYLLQLAHNVLPRVVNQLKEYDTFASHLRFFVLNSFDISDKLLLTHYWHLNDLNGTYLQFANNRLFPKRISDIHLDNKTADPWYNYMYCSYQFSMEIEKLLENNDAVRFKHDQPGTTNIHDRIKGTSSALADLDHKDTDLPLKKVHFNKPTDDSLEYYNNRVYTCDWILQEKEFVDQLRNHQNRLAVYTQLMIMSNFLAGAYKSNWDAKVKSFEAKFPKCKVPTEFAWMSRSPRENARASLEKVRHHMSKSYPEYEKLVLQILKDSELTWDTMKLKFFGHENVDKLVELSNPKKRKLEEHLESSQTYKKPYFQKLGTPKLSRIWRVQTGLDQAKSKSRNGADDLDDYKDGLENQIMKTIRSCLKRHNRI